MNRGSTDGSQQIIENFAGKLYAYRTENDAGQYDAINRGFLFANGQIMGWLNSNDLHFPWTLSIVGEIFAALPQIRWLTTCFPIVADADGRPRDCRSSRSFSRHGILRGETLPGSEGFVFASSKRIRDTQ